MIPSPPSGERGPALSLSKGPERRVCKSGMRHNRESRSPLALVLGNPFSVNWPLLANSLVLSGLTTLLAGGLGLLVALAAAGLNARARRCVLVATIGTLVLPPFLVTDCWLDLLGQSLGGVSSFPLNIYSLGGAVWLLTLLAWPVTTLFALGAWRRLEAGQLEMEPLLRGRALLRLVLWPMARPALGQAAALTFVLALNNFAVPVILQVKVYPEELWLAFTARLDEAGAWAACLPMVIAPALLLIFLRRAVVAWPGAGTGATADAFRRQLGAGWSRLALLVTAALLLVSLGLPLERLLLGQRTWAELPNLFRAAPDTVWNSFAYAAAAATACVGWAW